MTCPGPTPVPALLHLLIFSSVLKSQARVTSTAPSRACKRTICSTGTEVGSLPMGAKLRGAGDRGFPKPPVSQGLLPICRGGGRAEWHSKGPGSKGSAGLSGYIRETQRTFASSSCTEPEIADSWGNPSLPLSFLFNHFQAATAKPLGTQLTTDAGAERKTPSLKSHLGRFHITLLHFSTGEGKKPAKHPDPCPAVMVHREGAAS